MEGSLRRLRTDRIARAARAATFRLSREEWYALYEAARGAAMP
jgi:predicted oxidoreductase